MGLCKNYLQKAKKLNEELTQLKYRHDILQKEIIKDEEKLLLARSQPQKVYLVQNNINTFERVLDDKKMELIDLENEIRSKRAKYNKFIAKEKKSSCEK